MSKTYFEELEIRTLKMYLEVQSIILYIIMYSGRSFKIVALNKNNVNVSSMYWRWDGRLEVS